MFAIHDHTHKRQSRTGLPLAKCGQILLGIGFLRYVVKRDPQHRALADPEGRPMHPWCLAVVPFGGSLVVVARCYARNRPRAVTALWELATAFDWAGTPAAGLFVVEMTAGEKRFAKTSERA